MEPSVLVLLIIFGIVLVLVILVGAFPKLRNFLFPSTKKESVEENAKEAVEEIVTKDQEESKLDEEIKREKYQAYLLQKEKELNFYLSEDDINPLIIQLIQDEKDSKK